MIFITPIDPRPEDRGKIEEKMHCQMVKLFDSSTNAAITPKKHHALIPNQSPIEAKKISSQSECHARNDDSQEIPTSTCGETSLAAVASDSDARPDRREALPGSG